jgi:hypothetical protein
MTTIYRNRTGGHFDTTAFWVDDPYTEWDIGECAGQIGAEHYVTNYVPFKDEWAAAPIRAGVEPEILFSPTLHCAVASVSLLIGTYGTFVETGSIWVSIYENANLLGSSAAVDVGKFPAMVYDDEYTYDGGGGNTAVLECYSVKAATEFLFPTGVLLGAGGTYRIVVESDIGVYDEYIGGVGIANCVPGRDAAADEFWSEWVGNYFAPDALYSATFDLECMSRGNLYDYPRYSDPPMAIKCRNRGWTYFC